MESLVIVAVLEEIRISLDKSPDRFYSHLYYGDENELIEQLVKRNIDFVQEVDSWGGEGEGSSIGYVVLFKIEGTPVFVSVEGFYDSNNGSDYGYANVQVVYPFIKAEQSWSTTPQTREDLENESQKILNFNYQIPGENGK